MNLKIRKIGTTVFAEKEYKVDGETITVKLEDNRTQNRLNLAILREDKPLKELELEKRYFWGQFSELFKIRELEFEKLLKLSICIGDFLADVDNHVYR